jgi:hypothetical protein
MRATLAAAAAILAFVATPAFAHRVDEYLQATTISVEKGRVVAQVRLTPGVDVFPAVRAAVDTDRDGIFSAAEQQAYAQRVLRDLTLEVDGDRLPLRSVSSTFGTIEEMENGRGVIQIDFVADVPRGGADRRLAFENRHMSRMAVYLVNGLVPRDPDIQISRQSRNYEQSSYRMDYAQAGSDAGPAALARWAYARGGFAALGALAVLLVAIALLMRRRAQWSNSSGRSAFQFPRHLDHRPTEARASE